MNTTDSTLPKTLPKPPSRWGTIGAAFLILLCGMLIGAALTVLTIRHVMLNLVHHPERVVEAVAHRLDRTLSLTPDQDRKVRAILKERQAAIRAIRTEERPRLAAEVVRLRDDVAATLDERQAAKWKDRFDRLRARWTPES